MSSLVTRLYSSIGSWDFMWKNRQTDKQTNTQAQLKILPTRMGNDYGLSRYSGRADIPLQLIVALYRDDSHYSVGLWRVCYMTVALR